MKRLALIIGSPLTIESGGYNQGVYSDVENFTKFLISAPGGAWNATEILDPIINPTREEIFFYLDLFRYVDIGIIYFSGHGARYNGKDWIVINEDEEFRVSDLITRAKRQLIFTDSCRKEAYPWSQFIGDISEGYDFDVRNLRLARQLYDFYVSRSPLGGNLIMSSSPDQYSYNIENGGAFTVSLMDTISSWYKQNSGLVLSTRQAFTNASFRLSKMQNTQTPQHLFLKDMSAINIPLAVNPVAYLLRQKARTNTGAIWL